MFLSLIVRLRSKLMRKKRARRREYFDRPIHEALESRLLLSASTLTSTASGILTVGSHEEYSTLQAALNAAASGDTIEVFGPTAGAYFNTAISNLTIEGMNSSAVINKVCSDGEDGIDAEPGMANGITIEGITFDLNASRAQVRIEQATGVTVEGCKFEDKAEWALYTSFNTDDVLDDNSFTGTWTQHAIYVANSPSDIWIEGNSIAGDSEGGAIQINGDLSEGAPGIAYDCYIEANTILGGGSAGGAAINLDGVQDSTISGNSISGALHTGIAVFMEDGAKGPADDYVEDNTVKMASKGDTAVEIEDPAGTNYFIDNDILVGTVSLASGTVSNGNTIN